MSKTPGASARAERGARETRARSRVLVVLGACAKLLPGLAGAAGQPCTSETVAGLRGAFIRASDATSGATAYGFPRAQLPALLRDLDRYRNILEQAISEPHGFDVKWHKVVGFEPIAKGGAQPFALHGGLHNYRCENGVTKSLGDADGDANIDANSLFELFENTGVEIDGKKIFELAYPLGELRGLPLFESPVGSEGDARTRFNWRVLVAKPGRIPFRYVTRMELLDHMQAALTRERANAAQQKDPAFAAKLTALYESKLARVAAVRRALGPGQLGEPASLVSGTSPTSVDERWDFVEPKTDRTHRCTVDCRHGRRLVTVDPSYLDPTRPRGAPQFMVVSITWFADGRKRYEGPFDAALRDAFFQRLDVDALHALVDKK